MRSVPLDWQVCGLWAMSLATRHGATLRHTAHLSVVMADAFQQRHENRRSVIRLTLRLSFNTSENLFGFFLDIFKKCCYHFPKMWPTLPKKSTLKLNPDGGAISR